MSRLTFWGTSLLAAVAFAGATALLFPFGALGLEPGPEQHRAWLLLLWTSGVMAICFGATGLLSVIVPVGFREVHAAGSVPAALEERRRVRNTDDSQFFNFAGWTVCLGGFLILAYFAAWIAG